MTEPKDGEPGPIWESGRRPPLVRVVNVIGGGLDRMGVRWPRLEPEVMMGLARRRAKLSDFGDLRFVEGLRVLVDAFKARRDVHPFGRVFFRDYCVKLMVNRLKIQADLTRHPEILKVPVTRPLFITGLPRSGTTFLHRLMSEDPRGRTLLGWETIEPSPPPDPSNYATDPRIARAKSQIALIHRLFPRMDTAHELGAEVPEEDNNFFAHDFRSAILGFLFDVPEYNDWLREQDMGPSFAYARSQLQHLSWKVRADHWVLKAPAHQYGLEPLLAEFPDASVIVTHRDPLKVVPSVCSLASGFRSIVTDRLDRHRLGANFAPAIAEGPKAMMAARAKLGPARFLDIAYDRTVAEPIEVIRGACHHFGYEFSPEYEARARRYLASAPRHKHGTHRYRLEDFGLNVSTVNEHFADYRAWLADRGIVVGA